MITSNLRDKMLLFKKITITFSTLLMKMLCFKPKLFNFLNKMLSMSIRSKNKKMRQISMIRCYLTKIIIMMQAKIRNRSLKIKISWNQTKIQRFKLQQKKFVNQNSIQKNKMSNCKLSKKNFKLEIWIFNKKKMKSKL